MSSAVLSSAGTVSIPKEVIDRLGLRPGDRIEFEVKDDRKATLRPAATPEADAPERLRMGAALAALGRRVGLSDEDFAAIEQARAKDPAEPVRFG